jgi:alpha/beta superfamily hydrolase
MELPIPSQSVEVSHPLADTEVKVVVEHVNDEDVANPPRTLTLRLRHVIEAAEEEQVQAVTLSTERGDAIARYHAPINATTDAGVLWVGGAGGGLDGPARAFYPAACEILQRRGIHGLRLHYRKPNYLAECVLDTLLGVAYLKHKGAKRIALVGHSFGGAVVISAGAMSAEVAAVIPMSTQTYGADLAPQVSPRPLLLIHGTRDEILPHVCSELVYAAAKEPKELKLYEGSGHGLDRVRSELLEFVPQWLEEKLVKAPIRSAHDRQHNPQEHPEHGR